MKDSTSPKLRATQEKYDLLTALHGNRFFSAIYGSFIQVRGSAIFQGDIQIDQIISEERIDLLWSEYHHPESIITSNDLGLRISLGDQQLRRQGWQHE